MKYIKLFENFEDYDPYELLITPPNKKGEMLMQEIKKKDKANLNLVRDLITLGANIDWQDEDGWTALYRCAFSNHPEIAKMLISAGADLNIQDDNGNNPLHLASVYRSDDIVDLLLRNGSDPSIKNNDGRSYKEVMGLKQEYN